MKNDETNDETKPTKKKTTKTNPTKKTFPDEINRLLIRDDLVRL